MSPNKTKTGANRRASDTSGRFTLSLLGDITRVRPLNVLAELLKNLLTS